MSNFKRTFGPLNSPVPLSYLDDNFQQLESASTSTVSLAGAALIGFAPSGTGAVSTTVSEFLNREVWIENFGAVGDGATDNAAAIALAVAKASTLTNPVLKSGPGVFLIGSQVDLSSALPCEIDFAGTFRPYSTYTGFLFKADGFLSGDRAPEYYWHRRMVTKQPIRIDGFKSDNTARQSKAILLRQLDFMDVAIDVRWCVAQAVQLSGCREGWLKGQILRSGGANATTTDAPLYFYDESDIADANNNLRIMVNVSYPNGAIMYIGKNASASGTPRKIAFIACQLHYLAATISGSTFAYEDTTVSNGTAIDLAECTDIKFVGGNIRHGTATTGTLVKFGDTSAGTAVDRIKFIGTDFSMDNSNASAQVFDLQSVTTRIGLIDCYISKGASALTFSAGTDTSKVFTQFDSSYLDLIGSNAVVRVSPNASTSPVFSGAVSGDSVRRISIDAAGKHAWSDGSATSDTNLYRIAAGFVGTDNSYYAVKTYAQTENVKTSSAGAVTFVTGYNTITLTENITSIAMPASAQNGEEITITFIQSSGGANTVAGWPATVRLAGGAFTLTSTANKADTLTFKWKAVLGKWIEKSRSQNA